VPSPSPQRLPGLLACGHRWRWPVRPTPPPGDHRSLVNGGLVNVNLGSDDTAVGNTCNNTNESAPLRGDILAWALDVSHNACAMAGGPSHF